jgi:hypothetical protein
MIPISYRWRELKKVIQIVEAAPNFYFEKGVQVLT